MNVWILVDRYDHSETTTSAHLTEKGAMLQAYRILLETYDNIIEADGAELFKEEYPASYEFIKNWLDDDDEPLLVDLNNHWPNFQCYIGESTDWQIDVSIFQNRLEA
tara:strand:- start:161 stop:481 length:321 start_codon:yes stop_codon:yes gene_type:complete